MNHPVKSAFLCLALFVATASADVFTVVDPFNQAGPDVIGDQLKFDGQQISVNIGATSASIALYFNFGPDNASLDPFSVAGLTLNVGDLFLQGNGFYYGIALRSHNGVLAGNLYQINDSVNGVLTARQVLGDPSGVIYRPDEIVWMNNAPGALTSLAGVTQNLVGGGNGTTSPELVVTLSFDYALNSLIFQNLSDDSLQLHFATATCGNDIIEGGRPIPEPSAWAAIGLGLLCLGAKVHRRNRA